MVECRNVSFAYPGEPVVFRDLSWSVGAGVSWTVVGSSGAGKTTLLYLLAGLLAPAGGEIKIGGEPVRRPRPRTGLILQDLGLMPWSTAMKNVDLGLRIRRFYGPDGTHAPEGKRISRVESEQRVEHWLRRMQIWEHRTKYPAQLSGGQQQRVALARTFALDPDLLLMDEPFASLDAPTRRRFQDLLLELEVETGHTRIIVTHDVDEAAYLGRMILVVGRRGSPLGIVENPRAGTPAYRGSDDFARTCGAVVDLLERP